MDTKKIENIKILDCTIRDGGYLNNWQFDKKVVREVYRASSDAGVDIIELGFKSGEKFFSRDIYGIWRFCDEEEVREVTKGISGAKLGAMVDFGKIDISDFPESDESIIKIVRVAVHKNKIPDALKLIEQINDKGYETSLQMMGYSTFTGEEQKDVINLLGDSHLDYAYIADSYGSILPFQIKDLFEPLLEIPSLKVGFHPHNNLQMAFANTLEAINCGIHIIDGTIYGMGRGAGNLPIETFISYLQLQGFEKYNVIPILHCIDKYFVDFHKQMNWGYQLPYMLSGMFGCHSYYSKNLIDLKEYTIEDVWKALEAVTELKPVGFSQDILENLINHGLIGGKGFNSDVQPPKGENVVCTPAYINRHEGRDFLVLANGPNFKKYKDPIDMFIKKYNPIILGANYLAGLYIPDYHTFSNKRRFIDYVDTVDKKSRLLIGQNISDKMIRKYTTRKYERLCYVDILNADFDIQDSVIQSNCKTVSVLLMGVAIVMGAKRIFAAGLDGYINSRSMEEIHFYQEKDEPEHFEVYIDKHQWCEHFLNQINDYLTERGQDGIHILTPTGYKKFYKGIKNYI
jgi:4-hydroxy 2-oxovalerate aldolase